MMRHLLFLFAAVAGCSSPPQAPVAAPAHPIASSKPAKTCRSERFIIMGGNLASVKQVGGDAASRQLTGPEDFVITGQLDQLPRNPGDATVAVMYPSLDQFEADIAANKLPASVHWVIYDLEGWAASPDPEKQHPARAMKRFAELAHAHGLQVITIPYPNLAKKLGLKDGEDMYEAYLRYDLAGAAARFADITATQAQQLELDPRAYRKFVAATARQARAANPHVVFFSELTGTPEHQVPTAAELRRAYDAVDGIADGFYLSVGHKDPRIREEVAKFLAALPSC